MSQPAGGEARLAGALPGAVPDDATHDQVSQPTLARTGPQALSRFEIENVSRLLPYLSYSGADLAVGGIPVTRLWDGARPMLLYLPDRAVDNYRSIREAFARYFDVSVCCAIKTCYLGGMLSALRAAGAGAEIASEFEWRIARQIGFPPVRTVANDVSRLARHLERLLGEEVALIDIDSEEELA